jgi:8-oxo-dGTP diphosphatase
MKEKTKVGVVTILKNKNKILLGKRLTEHGFKEWGLVGGHLEINESIEDCAIREVNEETKIQIKSPKFITEINVSFPNKEQYKAIIFLSETSKDPENTEPKKLECWKWFDWNSLPEPLFLPVRMLQEEGIFKQIFENNN